MDDNPRVSILSSGIGLGVYVPALLIHQQLVGLQADLEVLEAYYTPENEERLVALQRACRESFDLALMGHRMTRGVEHCLDAARMEALLDRWAHEGRTDFMVWSGFWLPVLEQYRSRIGAPLHIESCRIDAVVSASFQIYREPADATEIWLWNWDQRRTIFEIPVNDGAPLGFAERGHRVVVHGGGGGIGTYRDRLPDPWPCDVIVHEDVRPTRPGDRLFSVDPTWRPWRRHGDRYIFPPFGAAGGPYDHGERHTFFDLVRTSKAIVSKPGGGTLIDSLASATPVILLEPYGYAEAKNGELWEHLGFGIPYAKWRDSGWDESVLHKLHRNIIGRTDRGLDYPSAYSKRVRERLRV
jgi:hypothetical protein